MGNYNNLLKEYRKLAKRADQRLVRIEQAALDKKYKGLLSMAYKAAARVAVAYGSRKNKPRFNIAPPKSARGLQAKIQSIKDFLNMETSTKSGYKQIQKKRVNKLNEKRGINFSVEDFHKISTSGVLDDLMSKYDSDVAIEIASTIANDGDKLKSILKEAKKKNISIEDINDYTGQDLDITTLSDELADIVDDEVLRTFIARELDSKGIKYLKKFMVKK